ncbi:MAG: colanic acid biosynthesis glycosyltransferase WcaL [Planctomycetota bacterium]|nr:MAG: colanic acid biosynthesis glycosyltransferase WcaL [Planctomycetota bacterium]
MRIAFLVNHFPVLSQTFVLNQITGLLERGHEIVIYAKSPGRQPVVHREVERYRLLERTVYYGTAAERVPKNKLMRLAKAAGIIAQYFPKRPIPILNALNVFEFGKRALSLDIFYKTAPFLGANEYDIVHCHFGPNGNLAALLKTVGAIKGKIVTTFHGEAEYTGEKRYKKGFAPLFEHGDLIMPMSEREKAALIRLGCSPRKIVVHRMGIDLARFPFVPRQPRENGEVHVLTIARLVEKKGVEYSIRAVANLLKRYPYITYKIVGDGPLRPEMADLIEKLGVGERVNLLGWRQREEVVELFRWGDILLAPSVTSQDGDREGIPVVLMEAMAQGLPVISTWHAGIPELVQDGQSGFLVPERNADALAEKLEHLVKHPDSWSAMGKAGREYVERHHDIDKLNDRLMQLYRRLLDGDLP